MLNSSYIFIVHYLYIYFTLLDYIYFKLLSRFLLYYSQTVQCVGHCVPTGVPAEVQRFYTTRSQESRRRVSVDVSPTSHATATFILFLSLYFNLHNMYILWTKTPIFSYSWFRWFLINYFHIVLMRLLYHL